MQDLRTPSVVDNYCDKVNMCIRFCLHCSTLKYCWQRLGAELGKLAELHAEKVGGHVSSDVIGSYPRLGARLLISKL